MNGWVAQVDCGVAARCRRVGTPHIPPTSWLKRWCTLLHPGRWDGGVASHSPPPLCARGGGGWDAQVGALRVCPGWRRMRPAVTTPRCAFAWGGGGWDAQVDGGVAVRCRRDRRSDALQPCRRFDSLHCIRGGNGRDARPGGRWPIPPSRACGNSAAGTSGASRLLPPLGGAAPPPLPAATAPMRHPFMRPGQPLPPSMRLRCHPPPRRDLSLPPPPLTCVLYRVAGRLA